MACYASTAWPGGRARVYSAQHNTQLLSTCLNMGGKMSVVLSRRSGKYGPTRLIQLVQGVARAGLRTRSAVNTPPRVSVLPNGSQSLHGTRRRRITNAAHAWEMSCVHALFTLVGTCTAYMT